MNRTDDQPLNFTLYTLERLSLTRNGCNEDDKTECIPSSAQINCEEPPCRTRGTVRICVSPYKLPVKFRRRSAPSQHQPSTTAKADLHVGGGPTLSTIRLHGCKFERHHFPLFDYSRSSEQLRKPANSNSDRRNYAYRDRLTRDNSPSMSSTPCWRQHDRTADYVAKKQQCGMATTVDGSSTELIGSGQSTDASASEPELDCVVDELSEYFQHFVNVRLKMSKQAESMYA